MTKKHFSSKAVTEGNSKFYVSGSSKKITDDYKVCKKKHRGKESTGSMPSSTHPAGRNSYRSTQHTMKNCTLFCNYKISSNYFHSETWYLGQLESVLPGQVTHIWLQNKLFFPLR